jgi:hypothetical protein
MADLDLRTMSERLRDEKHKNVCKRYEELKEQYPDVKPYRLIRLISIEVSMTVPGVRNILEKNNLYVNNQ